VNLEQIHFDEAADVLVELMFLDNQFSDGRFRETLISALRVFKKHADMRGEYGKLIADAERYLVGDLNLNAYE